MRRHSRRYRSYASNVAAAAAAALTLPVILGLLYRLTLAGHSGGVEGFRKLISG